MVAADYRDWSTHNSVAGWNKGNRDYSVSEISYDVNGNMLSMNQRGRGGSGQPATIDSLIYSYDVGNQLASVTDYGANGPVTDDFDNSVLNQAFYDYDQNGNLAEDDLKEIQIEYNYQDLPLVVENHKTSGIIYNLLW